MWRQPVHEASGKDGNGGQTPDSAGVATEEAEEEETGAAVPVPVPDATVLSWAGRLDASVVQAAQTETASTTANAATTATAARANVETAAGRPVAGDRAVEAYRTSLTNIADPPGQRGVGSLAHLTSQVRTIALPRDGQSTILVQ
ncbi:hypothetical protein [Lapillicoccus sp.]|uniref:hypothetical protein n=1 Tax=Lapillicoccus sp. TaxID=1909287 RepID=UPI003263B7D8